MISRPVGEHALLVLLDDARGAVAARELVLNLTGSGDDPDLPAPTDVVPAARTLLIDGLPGPAAVEAWRSRLAEAEPSRPGAPADQPTGRPVTIEVSYRGADIDVVAEAWGCSGAAVLERHQAAAFLVAFCGFAPGFAYCVPTSPLPAVPRRREPRERVPAGSVALAGEYCGVYPAEMPGGWQLIGATAATLFDPGRPKPALLSPGDTVRFRAVT